MNKKFTSLAFILSFLSVSSFGQVKLLYADDIESGWGDASSVITPYVAFPKASIEPYKGAFITTINVGVMEEATNAYIYIKNNARDNENLYRQKVDILYPGWNEIILETPFEIIADKDLAIGYKGSFSKAGGVGISSDKFTEADNVYYNSKNTWTTTGGSICITATLEGDNLPSNEIGIYKLVEDKSVSSDNTHTYSAYIRNRGVNTVDDCEINILLDGEKVETVKLNDIDINNKKDFTFSVSSDVIGSHSVVATVATVNGNPDRYTHNNDATASFTIRDPRFIPAVVCEEYTGTWCGWCPRGLVGLELMKDKYPGKFFAISIHGGDEMEIDKTADYSYSEYINSVSGAPTCNVNRRFSGDPFYDIQNLYNLQTTAENHLAIEANGRWAEDGKSITISGEILSDIDIKGAKYNIAFPITEDGITGYIQTNYYAGKEEFYGWESKSGATDDVIFNDVARAIIGGYRGMEVISGDITALEPNSFEFTINLPSNINNIDNINVIAQIIDPATNFIVNATGVQLNESGISTITQEIPVSVSVAGNLLTIGTISDQNLEVIVAAIDGKIFSKCILNSSWSTSLTDGLYIIIIKNGDSIVKRFKVKL